MLPLRCIAQNYEWGRAAASSEVAKLSKANGSDIDESKPFAELWMGTHPNCPSLVASTGGKLKDWIAQHPQVLGDKVQRCFKNDLPYLFKVLSVAKALSIQSHPDKRLAEKLHAEHPKMYADDNHKPEMALALSDFEALCGFVSTEELRVALATVPELRACVGEGPSKGFEECTPETSKKALRAAFTSLMTADAKLVSEQISALVARVEGALAAGREPTPKEKLALRLNGQFPLDVGVLSCFFLNHISLEDGQAIYLAANEPHAYLAGELMECMAASDNVIRAGLTPKFKHVDVLCSSLTYEQGLPTIMSGTAANDSVFIFRPPFEEFEMHKVQVAAGAGGTVPPNEGPRILLVQHGRCTATAVLPESLAGDVLPELLTKAELARGSIVFVPAATTITIDAQEAVTAWAAATNGNFFTLQDVRDSAAAKANGTEKVAEPVAA